jgi:hypothetical protein
MGINTRKIVIHAVLVLIGLPIVLVFGIEKGLAGSDPHTSSSP